MISTKTSRKAREQTSGWDAGRGVPLRERPRAFNRYSRAGQRWWIMFRAGPLEYGGSELTVTFPVLATFLDWTWTATLPLLFESVLHCRPFF